MKARMRIIRPDGTVIEVPAPDGRSLRRIRDKPRLTDQEKAEIFADCPVCGARAGRTCRNRAGRPSRHLERLQAWLEIARPSRLQSAIMDGMKTHRIIARRISGDHAPAWLGNTLGSATATPVMVAAVRDAVTFVHPEPAGRQADFLQAALGSDFVVTVEYS